MAAVSSNVVTKVMRVQPPEGERDRAPRARGLRAPSARRAVAAAPSRRRARGGRGASRRRRRVRASAAAAALRVAPVKRETPKIGRNDLCPCGSGEKFKKCHGAALEEEGSDDAQACKALSRLAAWRAPERVALGSRPCLGVRPFVMRARALARWRRRRGLLGSAEEAGSGIDRRGRPARLHDRRRRLGRRAAPSTAARTAPPRPASAIDLADTARSSIASASSVTRRLRPAAPSSTARTTSPTTRSTSARAAPPAPPASPRRRRSDRGRQARRGDRDRRYGQDRRP